MPTLPWVLLVAVVLLGGAVTLPQKVQAGPISGLAVISILGCAGAWALWLTRPYFPPRFGRPLLPLLLFCLYAACSFLWYPPSVKGLQLLCVLAGFFGFILLAARETSAEPARAAFLLKCFDWATLFATVVYAGSVALDGMGADSIIFARSFALFAMLGVARQLSLWQAADRWGLYKAGAIVFVIFLSLSRVALVAALLLFPMAAAVRGGRRGWAQAFTMTVLGAAAFLAAVFLSEEMYQRFFGYDVSMKVGGVWINSSGRTAMWEMLYKSAVQEPWFGWGVGSSSLLIDKYFPKLGHPHNDFLRFFHDFGAVGLFCWLAFSAAAFFLLLARARRCARTGHPDLPLYLTPLLAMTALGMSMFTDNSVSYNFVMGPMGVLIGVALGRLHPPARRTVPTATVEARVPRWTPRRRRPAPSRAVSATPAALSPLSRYSGRG